MKERILRVGKPTPLIGIATEPTTFDPSRPALLILNSGVMHHVGACRLSVKIARSVAERGVLAVRFDFSGIGDSEPRRGAESFETTSLRECTEVMDYLEKNRGITQFIIFGLCSGADAAYNTALADKRVIAFSQIDAYCYVTPLFYFHHYFPVFFNYARWKRFLSNQFRGFLKYSTPNEASAPTETSENFEMPTYTRIFPPRETVARGLSELASRGVKMQVIFTGGERCYNHQGQFRYSFRDVDFRDYLSVEYFPETNHIITQPAQQCLVVETVSQWITESSVPATPSTQRAVL